LDELEVGMPKLEDVDLKEVGEVDEHVGLGFFLATCDVEANGNDVEAFTAFGEFVFHGEGI
jgi:hypothetical protein